MISRFFEKVNIKFGLIALLLSSYIVLAPFKRLYWLCALGLLVFSIVGYFLKPLILKKENNKEFIWALFNVPIIFAFLLIIIVVEYKKEPIELFIIFLVLFFLGFTIIRLLRNDQIWTYVQSIIGAYVIFIAVDAMIQAVWGTNFFGIEKKARLGGFFTDDLKFGFYMAALASWAIFMPYIRNKSLVLQIIIFGLLAAVVFFGNTRAAWISFFYITIIFIYLERKSIGLKALGALIFSLIALVSIVLIFDQNVLNRFMTIIPQGFGLESFAMVDPIRWEMWKYSIDIIRENYFFGVGPGNFQLYVPLEFKDTRFDQPYAHQFILDILIGFGLIGSLLCLLSLFYLLFSLDYKKIKETDLDLLPVAPALMLVSFWFPLNSHRDPFGSEMLLVTWLTLSIFFSRLPFKNKA